MDSLRRLVQKRPKEIVDNPEGVEEESGIVRRALKYLKSGSALDAGAGMGRNSIFLARNGFRVTAMDVKERGMDILKEDARESGWLTRLRIGTRMADARDGIRGMYHLIVASRMLNFLERDQALAFIKEMKSHTKSGGLNVIETPTIDGDFFRSHYPRARSFYPDPEELRELYADWKILEYEEIPMEYKIRMEGDQAHNVTALLIAQKP